MAFNLKKKFWRIPITFLLIFSIVSSTAYLPVFAPKTEAFLGFGDINFEIGSHIRSIIDGIAMAVAQRMVDDMVKSTVNWANSGFDGNPAYMTDPQQYFADSADRGAISYLAGTKVGAKSLNLLCSPFQAQVRLALQKHYTQQDSFQCTLTDIVGNIEGFYQDFDQGGWDAWFSMTQNNANNPYGAYLDAQIELDSRIASAVGLKKTQLDANQGFLSWEECKPEFVLTQEEVTTGGYGEEGYKAGDCYDDGSGNNKTTVTPGSTIKAQLDKVLPSGLEKLITAQHVEQLVGAFATGLLNRYVFGSKGLFAKGKGSSTTGSNRSSNSTTGGNNNTRAGTIDLDNDGIPDGHDADFDGVLESNTDICYHGGTPPKVVGDRGCFKSSEVTSSPYFTPVCQAINGAVATLTDYTKFIDSHAAQLEGGQSLAGQIIGPILLGPAGALFGGLFGGGSSDNFKNKADADIWANRTTEANSSVEELLGAIQGRRSPYFDDMEIATNRFASFISNVMESLIKDKDLDLARFGSGGGGLDNLMKQTAYNLRYFKEVKEKIGKCENPNVVAVQNIPTPPSVPPPTPEALQQNGICATPAEIDNFLQNNPGDSARLPSAFPCANTNGNSNSNNGGGNVCASSDEIAQFLIDNPGDQGRLSSAFPCGN